MSLAPSAGGSPAPPAGGRLLGVRALPNGIGIGAVPEAMDSVNDDTVYDRVMQYLFRSGAMQPGERVVETQLAPPWA